MFSITIMPLLVAQVAQVVMVVMAAVVVKEELAVSAAEAAAGVAMVMEVQQEQTVLVLVVVIMVLVGMVATEVDMLLAVAADTVVIGMLQAILAAMLMDKAVLLAVVLVVVPAHTVLKVLEDYKVQQEHKVLRAVKAMLL